nr:TPA_asm: VP7 [Aedes orbi-like virus]
MGGPGDYPSDQIALGTVQPNQARSLIPKRKRRRNGPDETVTLIEEVQSMSAGAKRVFESRADARLRANCPKLRLIKRRIMVLRWIMYALAFLGTGITLFSMITTRETRVKQFPLPTNVSSLINVTALFERLDDVNGGLTLREYLHLFRDFWDISLVLLICVISNSLKNLHAKKDDLEEQIGEDTGIISASRFCTDLDSFYHDYRGRLGTHLG